MGASTARDFDKEIATVISLAPAARTATANGTGVDCAGFMNVAAIVSAGTITDGTHALKLQESDDNTTYADVAAGDQSGTFPANLTSTTMTEVGYLGSKRYVRAVTTVSGATTGGVYAAIIVRDNPRTSPQ